MKNFQPIINPQLTKLLNDSVDEYNLLPEGEEKELKKKELNKIADMLYGTIKIESSNES